MDNPHRHHRTSLSSSSFLPTLPASLAFVDDEASRFDAQCRPPLEGTPLRRSHDDFCISPSRCANMELLATGMNSFSRSTFASHMAFHSRHYDVPAVDPPATPSGLPFTSMFDTVRFAGPADAVSYSQQMATTYDVPGYREDAWYLCQVPDLTAAPPRLDEDNNSIGDSDCGVGDICHGTTCADDTSVCNDENCGKPAADITSEDANAAAALASFGTIEQQMSLSAFAGQHLSDFPGQHPGMYAGCSSHPRRLSWHLH